MGNGKEMEGKLRHGKKLIRRAGVDGLVTIANEAACATDRLPS
jgi:hypothetical protein